MTKLLPTLRQGDKGGAVNMLALLIKVSSYEDSHKIILDGEYTRDGEIAKAIKWAQKTDGLEVTGDFDELTRKQFREDLIEQTGLDIDELTVEMFTAEFASA